MWQSLDAIAIHRLFSAAIWSFPGREILDFFPSDIAYPGVSVAILYRHWGEHPGSLDRWDWAHIEIEEVIGLHDGSSTNWNTQGKCKSIARERKRDNRAEKAEQGGVEDPPRKDPDETFLKRYHPKRYVSKHGQLTASLSSFQPGLPNDRFQFLIFVRLHKMETISSLNC